MYLPVLLFSITHLGLQSRFGDELRRIRVACPQNGTAILKGLKRKQETTHAVIVLTAGVVVTKQELVAVVVSAPAWLLATSKRHLGLDLHQTQTARGRQLLWRRRPLRLQRLPLALLLRLPLPRLVNRFR